MKMPHFLHDNFYPIVGFLGMVVYWFAMRSKLPTGSDLLEVIPLRPSVKQENPDRLRVEFGRGGFLSRAISGIIFLAIIIFGITKLSSGFPSNYFVTTLLITGTCFFIYINFRSYSKAPFYVFDRAARILYFRDQVCQPFSNIRSFRVRKVLVNGRCDEYNFVVLTNDGKELILFSNFEFWFFSLFGSTVAEFTGIEFDQE